MNDATGPGKIKDPSALRDLLRTGRLALRLMTDKRVSWGHKLVPILALAYLLSPIDLLPDFALPGLGSLDDLAIIAIALRFFVSLVPEQLVREHSGQGGSAAGAEEPISADYRVQDPG